MRMILTSAFILTMGLTAFSQEIGIRSQPPDQPYSYAYISVYGKLFTKKLKVVVDFGDTPQQLQAGQEYSELLTNKKSYAAVLNYMVENQFELVETLDYTETFDGSGGTSGIVFLMRKMKSTD